MTTFQFRDIIHIFRSIQYCLWELCWKPLILDISRSGLFASQHNQIVLKQPICVFAWRASHGCITRSSQMFSNGFWFYTWLLSLLSSENMLVFWFLLYKTIICLFCKSFLQFSLTLHYSTHQTKTSPTDCFCQTVGNFGPLQLSLKENILTNNLKPVYGVSFMKIEPVVWQEFRNKHTDIHTVRSLQYKMIHKNTAVRMQRQNIKKKNDRAGLSFAKSRIFILHLTFW